MPISIESYYMILQLIPGFTYILIQDKSIRLLLNSFIKQTNNVQYK